ncbi:MAG: SUMF1/EgtB/PvdO family nonheme iron enzyme, partial [Bacteroidales bacterium]|nr:SUMF1/EgtB/PvdO family nonheme iron enzyme [Bacteroidales bacterium]
MTDLINSNNPVYISYACNNITNQNINDLCDLLKTNHINYFRDDETLDVNNYNQTEKLISKKGVFIAFLNSDFFTSSYCLKEFHEAFMFGDYQNRLLPILIFDTPNATIDEIFEAWEKDLNNKLEELRNKRIDITFNLSYDELLFVNNNGYLYDFNSLKYYLKNNKYYIPNNNEYELIILKLKEYFGENNNTKDTAQEIKTEVVQNIEIQNLVEDISSKPTPPPFMPSPSTLTIPIKDGVSIEMILVEGGTFTMGQDIEQSDDEEEPDDNSEENELEEKKEEEYIFEDDKAPAHQVTLDSYYIAKYPVTQKIWQLVMGDNPSEFKGEDRPVENVSWDDCQKFIEKLNSITNKKFSLPSEAQWEFAAQGGNKSKGYQYSGSDNLEDVAFIDVSETYPIGQKKPNELGIYDMSGNVFEWCYDVYDEYLSTPQKNPINIEDDEYHINRGGSWETGDELCLVNYRNFDCNTSTSNDLGLRLVIYNGTYEEIIHPDEEIILKLKEYFGENNNTKDT